MIKYQDIHACTRYSASFERNYLLKAWFHVKIKLF